MRLIELVQHQALAMLFQCLRVIGRKRIIPFSCFLGRLVFVLDRKHRRIVLNNLTNAFKDEKRPTEIRSIARQVFQHVTRIPFEIGLIPKISASNLNEFITIEGLHHLQEAYQQGKGVLILCGHLGCWELIPAAIGLLKYPSDIMVRPLDFKPLDELLSRLRTFHGGRLIPKKSSMRMVLKSLKAGRLVGILLDQNVDWYDGVFVKYFGQTACTNKGLAIIALKTNAPVIPCFLTREESRYILVIGTDLPLIQTGDKIKDVEANTQQYTKTIENMVRQYPEQWLWLHQRWKTRPFKAWPRVEERRINFAA
ncbi:MAG: lysophospholipid acyltransferase family protein [Pseudomonadota bacterium]